ncbi:pyrroline-5-carboxylate reductase [Lederbergia sp. NSJ-179]|uniref:pyrroline-5-carboxylate reductase n=1 Tax=Lederbergia sp. NSJ-179 TaxID=2931402 RepID=UPI001FCFCC9F|nr:pyrroline-5-carboxylate reductase [Lederbergia sp. NSJ-179]MCJ7839387.1 pyrroline-5-carboxylate reductase [Lederbergia sp. NSJ-179]
MKIAFVGAGSMAEAIFSGLLNKQICSKHDLYVMNRTSQTRLENLKNIYGIQTTYHYSQFMQQSDMVILAVKPKNAGEVLEQLQPYITRKTFIVSVMAGISIEYMAHKLKTDCAIARVMPNTSASVGKSATALAFNAFVSLDQQQLLQTIFTAIGSTVVVKENQLDAITGLSGSGPAYFYYIVEAMEKTAEKMGVEKEIAHQLIIQTLAGAAKMLEESGKEAAELRKHVTSPGGTTEAGLKILQEREVSQAVTDCILAAATQSEKLAALYSQSDQ